MGQDKKGGNPTLPSEKCEVEGGMKFKKNQAYRMRQLIREELSEPLKLSLGLWTREALQ